jgi:hypothetical protein
MVQNARVLAMQNLFCVSGLQPFVGPTVNGRKFKEQITGNLSYEVGNPAALHTTEAELLKCQTLFRRRAAR